MVVIEVEDDGLGIDADRVARRGRAAGLIGSESALDASTLLDLICAPGFSTREEADRTSGRGVGMNVVKNTILGLGGSFDLNTEPGRGTLFTIQLPLTVAIADALIVSSGDQRFAVPQSSVREVIEVESSQVKALENNEIISYRGGVLPLVRLSRLFRTSATNGDRFHAFVVGSGLNSVGVAIDRILGQREIVVRAISDPLIQVAGVAGATELGDGRIVLILDAAALARVARSAAPLCSGAEGAR
jgi:two-component system chemotaxis sensor kinase CheA